VAAVRHHETFENAAVALWDLDFSAVVAKLREMQGEGIDDLRTHLEANPELTAELLRLVRVVDVNSYAVELFEADGKEHLLGPLGAIFVPDTMPTFVAEVEALWRGERRFEGEAQVQTMAGRRMDVLFTIRWGGEDAEQSLVSVLDISKQKSDQRDAALLASIVESSDDAIASKDLQGIVTSWNQAAERLFGYTATEMIGSSITILFPPDKVDEEASILTRIRAGERVHHFETVRRTKEGRLVDVSLTISPVRDPTGRVIGASKIARDISERRRAEKLLSARAEEQAALLEFTDRLYRAESTTDIFEAALDAIIRALRCDRASILLFDAANVMRFVAWRGLSEAYRIAVDGHSPWTPESRDPAPIHVDDVDAADLPEDLRSTIRGEGIRALAFIPLLSRGRVVGKFMAYCGEPRPFTRADLDLGLTIAHQLGFGIERRQAEEHRDLLVAELSHRVKNTLTTVMSIARQTFTDG
jgi:PAS domain S-box-containing protein